MYVAERSTPYLEVSVVAVLIRHGDVELFKVEDHPLEVLLVLHPINEVPAYDVGLVGEGVVGREHHPMALALAQDLLVTLGASDVLRIRLDEICRETINNCQVEGGRKNIDIAGLTQLDIALRELVEAKEASILRWRSPFKRRESDKEHVLSRIYHQIPHLSAVGADLGGLFVRAVVHRQVVEGAAAGWSINLSVQRHVQVQGGHIAYWAPP